MKLYEKSANPDQLNSLELAFVGDAVYSLFIRERLSGDGNCPVGKLHRQSVQWVQASAQARAMRNILPLLSEQEEAVFKRARNAHPGHTPKNQSVSDYHYATGFEALCGYLYLSEEFERLRTLLLAAAESLTQTE